MPWAAAAAAAAALAGGKMQADSASKASGQQSAATDRATTVQANQFASTRADLAPYRAAGTQALNALTGQTGLTPGAPKDYKDWTRADFVDAYKKLFAERGAPNQPISTFLPEIEGRIGDLDNPQVRQYFDDIGLAKHGPTQAASGPASDPSQSPLLRRFSMEDLQSDPVMKASFDFGLSEGEKAVQRMFGSKGLARSGAAVKAATRFATDYTNSKAGESQQRFVADQSNVFSKLAAEAGIGQAATTTTGTIGANTSTNIGNLLTAEGNSRGAASIAQGNAYSGALSNIGNNAMGMYTLDRLTTRPNTNTTARQPAFSLDE